jgi:uncharacterized membrane protein YgcG
MLPLGPLDWTGQPFLILYLALLAIALVTSFVAPELLRPHGHDRPVTDPADLALLAGGPTRYAEAEVARRLATGELVMIGKDRFATRTGADMAWRTLSRDVRRRTAAIEARLRGGGLLLGSGERAAMRAWAVMPLVVLALFGTTKIAIGLSRDRPVGFLVALVAVTAILAAVRLFADSRTEAGRAAVKRARASHDRLRRAPTRAETALGVALFGTAVLAGSEFERLHQLRSSSGDGGGGGDGGGDGGGGGGCGGCGG